MANRFQSLWQRTLATSGFVSLLCILTVVSVSFNVLMALRLQKLTHTQSAQMAERLIKVGTSVPPMTVKRLDGQQEVLSYQSTVQPTVLYIFTPACSWCTRNMENFQTLVTKKKAAYRIIGLSLSQEGLPEYVAAHGLTIPIYTSLSIETRQTYKLGATPQTIVVSPEGHVLGDWAGAYVGNQKSEVEAFFHVSLPGVRPSS